MSIKESPAPLSDTQTKGAASAEPLAHGALFPENLGSVAILLGERDGPRSGLGGEHHLLVRAQACDIQRGCCEGIPGPPTPLGSDPWLFVGYQHRC